MKNASAAALAALALLSNVACTSFAPVSPTTLAPGARLRLSAPRGLMLVGGTPDAPAPLLTCEVRAVEGRVTRVMGDSVALTNIVRRTLAPDVHPRCVRVLAGVAYAHADAEVLVEQRQPDSGKTGSAVMATVIIVGMMLYAFSNMKLRAVN
jgi:hypothetical protein